MNQRVIKLGVLAVQLAKTASTRLSEDRGEVSSWLILAAGLALVAIFIGEALLEWAGTAIETITSTFE